MGLLAGYPWPTGQSAPATSWDPFRDLFDAAMRRAEPPAPNYSIEEVKAATYSAEQSPLKTSSVGLVTTRLWSCATNGCPERPGIAAKSAPTCYTCARPMVERLGGFGAGGLEWEPVQSTWCCPATTCADRAPIRAVTAPRCYTCGTTTRPAISFLTETLDAMKNKLASASAMPVMWTCTESACVGRAPVRSATQPRCYTCARPMLARPESAGEYARRLAQAEVDRMYRQVDDSYRSPFDLLTWKHAF